MIALVMSVPAFLPSFLISPWIFLPIVVLVVAVGAQTMPTRQQRARFLLALMLMVTLAGAVHKVTASDTNVVICGDCFDRALCNSLEKYGYWWYFWDCGRFEGR